MLNAGSPTSEMAEKEEVTEVSVDWLSVMQTWKGDLHYAISEKWLLQAFQALKFNTLSSPCISNNADGHLQDLRFASKVSWILQVEDQSFEEGQCSRIDWNAVFLCSIIAGILRWLHYMDGCGYPYIFVSCPVFQPNCFK